MDESPSEKYSYFSVSFAVHMNVLVEYSVSFQAPLYKCADLGRYQQQFKLGIEGSKQPLNASLDIQLCSTWIGRHEGVFVYCVWVR